MPRRVRKTATDLRGAVRLATDATAGLVDLVEAMHARIARPPGWPAHEPAGSARSDPASSPAADPNARTTGLTGLVYRTIRGVTRLSGGSLDALLGLVTARLGVADGSEDTQALRSAERDAVVAALNGVIGDHLAASGNPLATAMSLRSDGLALDLRREALAERLPAAGGRLLVLLHGLCMNDRQWRRNGHDHGEMLARAAGYTPVYLHYNSGLHISHNGRALARLLDTVLAQWPQPLERVVLLAHSMGGLVARSALHQAQAHAPAQGTGAAPGWAARIDDLVCLGTPQHGAPLERAGHWVDVVLGATPHAAPLARLGRVRSAGITDLRHGNLLDEDWAGHDRFAHAADRRQPVPLPPGVRCHALAASLGTEGGRLKGHWLGDGLVSVDSALGRHAEAARQLDFAPERTWVGHGLGHLDLLDHPAVAEQLRLRLA
jgi:hypothetical protein